MSDFKAKMHQIRFPLGLLWRGGRGKGKGREGEGGVGKEKEGREERGMAACTHWDFRKSAPMLPGTDEGKEHCSTTVNQFIY